MDKLAELRKAIAEAKYGEASACGALGRISARSWSGPSLRANRGPASPNQAPPAFVRPCRTSVDLAGEEDWNTPDGCSAFEDYHELYIKELGER